MSIGLEVNEFIRGIPKAQLWLAVIVGSFGVWIRWFLARLTIYQELAVVSTLKKVFVKKLKYEPPTKEMKRQLMREIAVEVLVNAACIIEKADETLLPGVYKEFGKDLRTDPTGIGSLTLFRSLVQCICYLLVVSFSSL